VTTRFPYQHIDWNTPLVDADGKVTPYFQRQLFGQLENAQEIDGSGIVGGNGIDATGTLGGGITISADEQEILDAISDVHGTVLFRGATDWEGLPPGTNGQFFRTQGAGADPVWAGAGYNFSGCRLTKTTSLTGLGFTGGGAAVTFDNEEYDTDSFHSGSNAYLSAPADGYYDVSAAAVLQSMTSATWVSALISQTNSSDVFIRNIRGSAVELTATFNFQVNAVGLAVPASAGDRFRFLVRSESDTSIDFGENPSFSVHRVG